MELTVQDIKNAIVFLERVDLKGKEAQAMTELMMKLNFLGQEMSKPPEDAPDGITPINPPAGKTRRKQ